LASGIPELKENITTWKRNTQRGQMRASIADDKYMVLSTISAVDNWARSMATGIADAGPEEIHFGLDTEWNIDESRDMTRVISLFFPE